MDVWGIIGVIAMAGLIFIIVKKKDVFKKGGDDLFDGNEDDQADEE